MNTDESEQLDELMTCRLGETRKVVDPCSVVIFGASGDLTARKLIPALYHLFMEKALPTPFRCVAFDLRTLVAEVQSRPMNERVIDLARVLAYVDSSPLKVREAENIKADPPMVYWAPAPAILVNLDGDPVWGTIEGLDLRYALNTNWDLLEHTPSKMFYLRYNLSWLQASAVTGPWSPLSGLPT